MIYIFYHHPCSDGVMAATIAYESLRNANESILLIPSPPAKFPTRLPLDYQEPTKGDTIYLLDTCFDPSTLQTLSQQINKNVIVLDHHEYSGNWFTSFCDGTHDIHRSGCRLAWDYFFPDETPPRSVLYVEDRDLCSFGQIKYSTVLEGATNDQPFCLEKINTHN